MRRARSRCATAVLTMLTAYALALIGSATALAAGPEAPETTEVSGRSATGATLNGVLNPGIVAPVEAGEYEFLYKATATPTKAQCESVGASKAPSPAATYEGLAPEPVVVGVEGLTPGTEYVVCLAAKDLGGRTVGAPIHFTTAIPPEAPAGVTYRPGSATATTAELEGVLNPLAAGEKGTYEFIYRAYPLTESPQSNCEEGSAPNPAGAMTGVKGQKVTDELTGLQPNARYAFCLRVHNEAGEEANAGDGYGGAQLVSFQTNPAPPVVENESTATTATGTQLSAQINPNNEETEYHFEYSASKEALEAGEGMVIKGGPALPAVYGGQAANASPALTPSSTYYYRVATENEQSRNEGPPVLGEIQEVTTPPAAAVTTGDAENITSTSATLTGTVNPQGVQTNYYFQYISTAAYDRVLVDGDAEEKADPFLAGAQTATARTGESNEPELIPILIATGLLFATTYYYRLLTTNPYGTVAGETKSFTTQPGAIPGVSTGVATNISATAATLTGIVVSSGLPTTYAFELGTEPGVYGPPVGAGGIGSGASEPISLTLGGLQPGTTYYFRLRASNAGDTVYGQPQTFTTPGFSNPLTIPASPALVPSPPSMSPKEPPNTTVVTTHLTKAQKLRKALQACKRGKTKAKRLLCEKLAKRKYGPAAKKHKPVK
jgi:hypothetical protein